MVEIGDMPIIWHIMKIYYYYGFSEFVICLGYKGEIIKNFFKSYYLNYNDSTVDTFANKTIIHNKRNEKWKVTLVDTGLHSMTGSRISKIQKYTDEKPFFLTYGDGLSNINIHKLLEFHKNQNTACTVSAVKPEGRFGVLNIDDKNVVNEFQEKNKKHVDWINGGFFVCEQNIFQYLDEIENLIWERKPLESLAKEGQLSAYKHDGFWQTMDTLKDKTYLNELWNSKKAKWKIW
jgi:glucose-1-phosphate cytidylyltransferase